MKGPLERVHPAVFIDAIMVKVRDGQVANQPFYAAIGVDLEGHKDILGIWAGGNSDREAAKFWLNVLTELRNRGVRDAFGGSRTVARRGSPRRWCRPHHPPDP